jgi:hypothetical protein
MAVVGIDSALDVSLGHFVGVELRRAYYLVSALTYRHPLFFAYVAANFLNRDKKVLFAYP